MTDQPDQRPQELTDDELVEAAEQGMRGSGTIPEMLRRVARATDRLTRWIIFLMILQIAIAALSLWLAWKGRR